MLFCFVYYRWLIIFYNLILIYQNTIGKDPVSGQATYQTVHFFAPVTRSTAGHARKDSLELGRLLNLAWLQYDRVCVCG